ncbi:MAG: hypothetical protein ABF548_00265, partial [Gluconobacter oxydans]
MSIETSRIGRKCERAVVTAYQELREVGQPDMPAVAARPPRVGHPPPRSYRKGPPRRGGGPAGPPPPGARC